MPGGPWLNAEAEARHDRWVADFMAKAWPAELEAFEEGRGAFEASDPKYQGNRSSTLFCPYSNSSSVDEDGNAVRLQAFWVRGWRESQRDAQHRNEKDPPA